MHSITLRETLENGLQVLYKPLHSAPIVSIWVWVRHGSRDEGPGETGQAHWIEHMQFKGTPNHPGEELDRQISRLGGIWNAFTYLDWTAYFTTLPAEHVEVPLALESDRLVNTPFHPEDVETERTVILSEMEGDLNSPYSRLSNAVQAAAFRVHPYSHPVIGLREDLLNTSRDDLYRRYRNFYVPNNVVLSIAGHFEPEEMQHLVRKYFGDLQPGEVQRREIPVEPPLPGEIRIEQSGNDDTPFLQVAWRVPEVHHPDTYALHLLAAVLTGATSAGLMGGGLSNKTSRLYRALVESGLAAGVHGNLHLALDPFLFTIGCTLPVGMQPENALQKLDEVMDDLLQNGVNEAERLRALKQTRALFAYGVETVTQQASWLGYLEMMNAPDWFDTYLERLAAVSKDDLERAARTWLRPDNRLVGIYRPEAGA